MTIFFQTLFRSVFFYKRVFGFSHKSKYHSIYKSENFGTRFVCNKKPLQKCQPLDHSAFGSISKSLKNLDLGKYSGSWFMGSPPVLGAAPMSNIQLQKKSPKTPTWDILWSWRKMQMKPGGRIRLGDLNQEVGEDNKLEDAGGHNCTLAIFHQKLCFEFWSRGIKGQ